MRKELAIAWLAEDQVSFAEIADRLGFADSSSFYKAFRKWYGCNPGHYRTLIGQDQPERQTSHPD
ncbi:Helix-turn-helix domain protein [compost metagenome]